MPNKKSSRGRKGDGSIFQRADGTWEARLDLGREDGQRKFRGFKGQTRAAVHERLKRARADRVNGIATPGRTTVGAFFDSWLERIAPDTKPLTLEFYKGYYQRHLKPSFEKIALSDLSVSEVQVLIDRKRAAGLAAGSIRHIRTVLSRGLAAAMKLDHVHRNVARLVDVPKAEPGKVKPLSQAQSIMLFRTVAESDLEALFVLGLMLGLRRGELLGLRWQDIDFDRAQLSVAQAMVKASKLVTGTGRGAMIVSGPKTKRSARTLPMPVEAVRALKAHRARQNERRLAAGPGWLDNGLIFTNEIGEAIEPRTLQREFKRLLQLAQLPLSTRLHDLRHGSASMLLARGKSLHEIAEFLGHSSIQITSDVYAHLSDEMKRSNADAMDEIFSGARR